MIEKKFFTLAEIEENDKKMREEMRQTAAAFRDEDDWANQPRAVWSGEAMEKELDELFPVEVGVKAIEQRHQMIEEAKKRQQEES